MQLRETQLVVIGAGPGGYPAAFAAADAGFKVILVDADEHPGGVCLNRGCIPSKTCLHLARLIGEAREATGRGVRFAEPTVDVEALRQWKNEVISKNAAGIRQLAKARGVELIRAWARFEDSENLLLSSQRGGEPDLGRLHFERCILASGSRPATIKSLDINSPRVMNSTGALDLPDIPKSLLVVGGGYIGLEMSTLYAAFGSTVTVVEATDGLLPGADRDLVRILTARLRKTVQEILLSTQVTELKDVGDGVVARLEPAGASPREQKFDRVLISVGRTPNSDGLGLENTKVKINPRGFVEIDAKQRTADEHIWAIGDVVGDPMLAHKATYEAKIAVEALRSEQAQFDARAIPAVVFTDPEIAWAGLTETNAAKQSIAVQVVKFPWGASGRATSMGRNDGLTKLIVSTDTQQVLGVAMVGVGVSEMIGEAALAIEMGATARDLARTIHPHPTLSETLMEVAEHAIGSATHLMPKKAR